jgi:hypothetical protein
LPGDDALSGHDIGLFYVILKTIPICINVVFPFLQEKARNEDGMEWSVDWAKYDAHRGGGLRVTFRSGRAKGKI